LEKLGKVGSGELPLEWSSHNLVVGLEGEDVGGEVV
jgi:hypothetical protein